jgi:hypothetical protein
MTWGTGPFGLDSPWGGVFGLLSVPPGGGGGGPGEGGGDGGGVGVDLCVHDHRGAALDRLVEQFRSKPNVDAFISALVRPIQRLEDALCQLLHQRSLPAGDEPLTAAGEQLNVIGRIVGFRGRDGRTDEDYLRLIQAAILANRSEGTLEELIAITILVTGVETGIVMRRENIETLVIIPTDDQTTPLEADFLMRFLNRAGGLGVRIILEFRPSPENQTFSFGPGGPGLGFGAGRFAGARSNGLTNQPVIP